MPHLYYNGKAPQPQQKSHDASPSENPYALQKSAARCVNTYIMYYVIIQC